MDFKLCGQDMITHFLRERQLPFAVDRDGGLSIEYREGDGPILGIGLYVEGANKDMCAMRSRSEVVFELESRGRLMDFTDEWNRTKHWPKAFTVVDADGKLTVIGEMSWLLTEDIGWPLFSSLIVAAVPGFVAMFEELQKQPLPPTAAELNTWLDRAG